MVSNMNYDKFGWFLNEFYNVVKDNDLSIIEEEYKGIILGFVKLLLVRLNNSKDYDNKVDVVNKESVEFNNNVLTYKLEEYRESLRLLEYSKNTIKSYVCDIKQWIDFIRSRNITIINKDCMIEYSKYI